VCVVGSGVAEVREMGACVDRLVGAASWRAYHALEANRSWLRTVTRPDASCLRRMR
jgi:hypothetical protein